MTRMDDLDRGENRIRSAATGAPGREPRFVVFLGGLLSHSQQTPDDFAVRDDFAPLRDRLAATDPTLRFLTFSYAAGPRLRAGGDPSQTWVNGDYEQGEPVYSALDTTDRPLADHVAGLEWLLRDLHRRYPDARIDLIGFSLGGIIALAWAAGTRAADPVLAAVHRIVLISSPVGGISPLGSLTPKPGIRHALAHFQIGFGQSQIFEDLRSNSTAIAALRAVPANVDVASVENSRDYLINGRRITGQRLLPIWVRTIPLGRGASVTGFLPKDQCYVDDLGGWEQHLRTTHHHVLRGDTPAIERARQHIVSLVLTDGPRWISRQSARPATTAITSGKTTLGERAPARGRDTSFVSMTMGLTPSSVPKGLPTLSADLSPTTVSPFPLVVGRKGAGGLGGTPH